jgi:hypothetical protein
MIERKELPGASQSGLDLVGDQKRTRVVARRAGVRQVSRSRHQHSGLDLDGFESTAAVRGVIPRGVRRGRRRAR